MCCEKGRRVDGGGTCDATDDPMPENRRRSSLVNVLVIAMLVPLPVGYVISYPLAVRYGDHRPGIGKTAAGFSLAWQCCRSARS